MIASRRSFLAGLGSLLAAPAIVRAEILMPVRGIIVPTRNMNSLLTIEMITREAIKLFVQSNAFLQNIDLQYRERYAFASGPQWTDAELEADGEQYRLGSSGEILLAA